MLDFDNTVVYTSANPTIEATKTFTVVDEGDGSTGVGDTIVYNITVQNTGNVLLSNINLVEFIILFNLYKDYYWLYMNILLVINN